MQVNFLNRYLYSPQIWLHYINPKLKIYTILIFLFIINYINSIYLAFILIIYITIIRKLNTSKKRLVNLLVISTFFSLLSCLTAKQYINFANQFHICIPYITKINYISKKQKNLLYSTIVFIYSNYRLPNFIFRAYILNLLNLLLTNILFTTTFYEDIILLIIDFRKSNLYKKNTVVIACTSQFLEEIMNYFHKLLVAIKLRSYSINTPYILIININQSLISFINKYITLLSVSINLKLNTEDVKSI